VPRTARTEPTMTSAVSAALAQHIALARTQARTARACHECMSVSPDAPRTFVESTMAVQWAKYIPTPLPRQHRATARRPKVASRASSGLRRPLGELALQGPPMHRQRARRGRDVAVVVVQDALDVLPLETLDRDGRHVHRESAVAFVA